MGRRRSGNPYYFAGSLEAQANISLKFIFGFRYTFTGLIVEGRGRIFSSPQSLVSSRDMSSSEKYRADISRIGRMAVAFDQPQLSQAFASPFRQVDG